MAKGMLVFFCGKMGAGKSTLAKQIVKDNEGVLINEDDLLSKLYANKITSVKEYKHYSDLLKPVVENLAKQMMNKGMSVVLDFPANTPSQREWLRGISDSIGAEHLCYLVDKSDNVCISQLLKRGNPNTDTEEMFHAVSKFFTKPKDEERINLIRVYKTDGIDKY